MSTVIPFAATEHTEAKELQYKNLYKYPATNNFFEEELDY